MSVGKATREQSAPVTIARSVQKVIRHSSGAGQIRSSQALAASSVLAIPQVPFVARGLSVRGNALAIIRCAWHGNFLDDLSRCPRYAKSNRDIGLGDNANKPVSVVDDRYPPNLAVRHRIERRLEVIIRMTQQRGARHHVFKSCIRMATLGYDL